MSSFKQAIVNVEESISSNMKKKLMRLAFPLETIEIELLNNHFLKLIGDAHLKMLIILEVLGGCGRIYIQQYEKEADEIGIPIGNNRYRGRISSKADR